ncbi:ATP-dependent DNA helicase MER3 [Rhizophlyctis rosea]|nr:ATP-dependent DNA helicase MER3 [Rhizophlyctis rosea]
MLNEAGRGATLEVVVSRMQTVSLELQNQEVGSVHRGKRLRLLALSATVPNIDDIAAWLKEPSGAPAETKIFGEEFRPVQLQKEVLAFPANPQKPFAFEHTLNYK